MRTDFKYARPLTFALAGATAISDAVYLVYLFMLALSISAIGPRSRWAGIAIACVGIANVVVGGAFFF